MDDNAAINQKYFNKLASEYDQRFENVLVRFVDELRASTDFIGFKPQGRLLDYACGTGLLTRALGPQMSQCVGIDVSESMVEAYNAKAKMEGTWPDSQAAHLGNLLSPSDPNPAAFADDPNFSNFDMAGVGAGFHHFDDPPLAAARLVERLRPGGVLFILDFMPHQVDDATPHQHGVLHHGFGEGQVRDMFEQAGAGEDFRFKELPEPITFGKKEDGQAKMRRVFFARGTKRN